MQRKLTAIQANEVRKALESLENTIHLLAETVIGVGGRMYKLETHLRKVCEYGTIDGKPWVEPEPPIPEGYRKANADEWQRKDVRIWLPATKRWELRFCQGDLFDAPIRGALYIVPINPPIPDGWRKADHPNDYKRGNAKFLSKLHHQWRDRSKCSQGLRFFSGYTYIVPVDPPLTDQDAKDRPWVMAKEYVAGSWQGPYRLLVGPPTALSWVVLTSNRTILFFGTVRRATAKEIQQAGLDRSENTAKVEPCRGHDQQGPQ
jgi:hypothetical protein